MDTDAARKRIDGWFPNLAEAGYEPQSDKSIAYNCIAWAAGEDHRRWDPAPGYYWPPGIERDERVETLVKVFQSLGYERCEQVDPSMKAVEAGVAKVAIYADVEADTWTHAARQLPSGKWTSKLGDFEDIEHDSPEGLAGGVYMSLACIMKAERKTP